MWNLQMKEGVLAVAAVGCLGGCQMVDNVANNDPQPAVLANGEPESLDALKTALAGAVGRAQIELGPSDPTTSSVVTVPPPPLHPTETHSTAMPTTFKLMLKNGDCIAVNEKTGEVYALKGVSCRAAD